MVPNERFELPTFSLQVSSSTVRANSAFNWAVYNTTICLLSRNFISFRDVEHFRRLSISKVVTSVPLSTI